MMLLTSAVSRRIRPTMQTSRWAINPLRVWKALQLLLIRQVQRMQMDKPYRSMPIKDPVLPPWEIIRRVPVMQHPEKSRMGMA